MFNGVQTIVKESLDHSIIIIPIWKFAIVLRHVGVTNRAQISHCGYIDTKKFGHPNQPN
jgi:hypothetical protein